jgi:hypothetical protein
MQYRMFMQRSLAQGPIVDNQLTTAPNAPHIPVFFYWGVARLAGGLGASLGITYAVLGSVFAFLLVLLLFRIIDRSAGSRYRTWWILVTLVFGGGLGAYLKFMDEYGPFRRIDLFRRVVTEGLANGTVFDSYRNHYIVTTLFDTHFLFFLLMALLAVVAFRRALEAFSAARVAVAAGLAGLVTVLHIYDGVTLLAIGAGVVVAFRLHPALRAGPALATLAAATVAVGAAVAWQMWLFERSGLEIPHWRAPAILFSELALAYPLAWGLLAWGLGRYWRGAGFDEAFLLGWAGGCVALTLAGPFYPYPDRGVLTLQVPIMIMAGAIYFARFDRVRRSHAILAVLLLAGTPLWKVNRERRNTSFAHHMSGEPPPYIWLSPDHQRIAAALRTTAGERDVLIVDKTRPAYRTDDLWLTLGYPGKLYAGHYALTPDYDAKRAEVNGFFAARDPIDGAAFLQRAGATLVYARADQDVEGLRRIPGLTPLETTPTGTLFRFEPAP